MAEKKKFFEVELPLVNSSIRLNAFKIEQIDQRFIKLDLTRMLKGKSIEATFRVDVKEQKALGTPVKMKLFPFFIRRMMRRSTSYVEDSFLAEGPEAVYRIKVFMITRKKVTRAVRKALRNKAKEYILDYIKDKDSNTIFDEVIDNKIQKSLSVILKKIYPLALCEIRAVELEKEKEKVKVEKVISKAEEAVKEEKEEKPKKAKKEKESKEDTVKEEEEEQK